MIKNRIIQIKNSNLSFDELLAETNSFLHQYCKEDDKKVVLSYIYTLIVDMINADGVVHPAEEAFLVRWKEAFPE